MNEKQSMTGRQKKGLVILFLGSLISIIFGIVAGAFAKKGFQTAYNLTMLFATSGTALSIYALGRMVLSTESLNMNLKDSKRGSNYIKGLFVGALLILAYLLSAVFFKGIRFAGLGGISALNFILYMVGFGIQGFSEELLVRGLIQEILAKKSRWMSLVLPSIFFSLLHLGNDNFSLLAMINTTLIGLLFAIMTDVTGSLWMASGAHSIWNFLLGPFFGLYVSGRPMEESFLRFPPVEGQTLTNGGLYGPEAAVLVTVIIVIALVVSMFWIKQPKPVSAH